MLYAVCSENPRKYVNVFGEKVRKFNFKKGNTYSKNNLSIFRSYWFLLSFFALRTKHSTDFTLVQMCYGQQHD